MASLKAPGSDDVSANLFCQCMSCLLPLLNEILVKCRCEGKVPQDMCDTKIITLYKNNGARLGCNNNHGIISKLGIDGKAFAREILPRLHKLAERVYPEFQCGFRSQNCTTDMIFSVRQLQEKCKG